MFTLRRTILIACCLTVGICMLDTAGSAAIKVGSTAEVSSAAIAGDTVLLDGVTADQLRPLPANTRVITHEYGNPSKAYTEGLDERGEPSALIYSNTNGGFLYSPGRFYRIADDLHTELYAPCNADKFLVRVNGGVEDGDDYFDVTVRLQEECPNTVPYNDPGIPGTEFKFTGLDDDMGTLHDLIIDFNDPDTGVCSDGKACHVGAQDCTDSSTCLPFENSDFGICDDFSNCRKSEQDCADGSTCVTTDKPGIPSLVWVRLDFSTNRAGWVVGEPPTRGFSTDQYSHVITGCNTWYGGYPAKPHASFYTQVWAPEDCPRHFLAYLSMDVQREPFELPPGTEYVRFGDDIELTVPECELSVIEVGTKGYAGPYEIEFDLRNFPTDDPFSGSEQTWACTDSARCGQGNLRIARLEYEEGLILPASAFWITWKADRPGTGVLNPQRTQAGNSGPQYACQHPCPQAGPDPEDWAVNVTTPDGLDAAFYVAVFCRGYPPPGACCTAQPNVPGQDPVCYDDVPVTSCLGSRWLLEEECPDGHNDPDDPWAARGQAPCGSHACCMPNNNCNDIPRDECTAMTDMPCQTDQQCRDLYGPQSYCDSITQTCPEGNPARWFPGTFCDDGGFGCPWFACFDATGDCYEGGIAYTPCEDGEPDPDTFCRGLYGEESYCGEFGTCVLKRGCGQLYCCDYVCDHDDDCCAVGWDNQCAALAYDCPGPPGNDNCHDPDASMGAFLIGLVENPPDSGQYRASKSVRHTFATVAVGENGFCCHRNVGYNAAGPVWYKFVAARSGSARVHTCDTGGSDDAADSILQVFRAVDKDAGKCDDGTPCDLAASYCADLSECVFDEETVCADLEQIGCNDDGPSGTCGDRGANSDLCIGGVVAGELYYIQIGGKTTMDMGQYTVTVEQPCRAQDVPPAESVCEGALSATPPPGNGPEDPFSVPFDLTNATYDCPGEDCSVLGDEYEMQTMRNDIWFDYVARCTGELHVETCGVDPEDPDPDTTLAVYEGEGCPPDPAMLLACNDDAVVDAFNHTLRDQNCSLTSSDCDTDEDCAGAACTTSRDVCEDDSDCDVGACDYYDDVVCSISACDEGVCVDGTACSHAAQNCDTGVCTNGDWCDIPSDRGECEVGGALCSVEQNNCANLSECISRPCADHSVCRPRCLRTAPDCECDRGYCEDGYPCDIPSDRGECAGSGYECVVSLQDCEDLTQCVPAPCADGSECDPSCVPTESCEPDVCLSSCGFASTVVAPVSIGQNYKIRLGGFMGGEPSGDLTIQCETKDCNGNLIPDPFDIRDGNSEDCNMNGVPDECDVIVFATSDDCNENDEPDECEIYIGTGDGTCSNDTTCFLDGADCSDGSPCVPHGRGPFFCIELCERDRNWNAIPDVCEGACCQPWGDCDLETEESCEFGVFMGGGINACTDGLCGEYGACCTDGTTCNKKWRSECEDAGGLFMGDGTECDPNPCTPPPPCPDGAMTFTDPEDGTVDARQPRDINNAATLQGIDTIMASGPADAADPSCWSLCETQAEGGANGIASVTEDTPGNYTITLDRRITPGAVTKITYTPDSDPASVGTFTSLPADSTADGVSNTADILGLIDCCLNLVCTPPWGMVYSCDIDQSAVVNTADILRLIDLLNGAGQFTQPWNLASPYDGGECP
ncbi:MAG: hypothetical protein JSU63_14615 [Phycisphaerales bacterium]|nr:MAG: hypothetical protein JSU63_14615 [Phycisphaerales bacterium]